MKVILLRDVAKIGHRFDIVEVPDGYAMNKLVPQKSAAPATPENVKRVRAQKDKAAASSASEHEHFDAVVSALSGKTATMSASANQEGGLFEAAKLARIAEALTVEAGRTVPPEYISLETPIKHTGKYQIVLVQGEKKVEVALTVTAQ